MQSSINYQGIRLQEYQKSRTQQSPYPKNQEKLVLDLQNTKPRYMYKCVYIFPQQIELVSSKSSHTKISPNKTLTSNFS